MFTYETPDETGAAVRRALAAIAGEEAYAIAPNRYTGEEIVAELRIALAAVRGSALERDVATLLAEVQTTDPDLEAPYRPTGVYELTLAARWSGGPR